MPLCILYKVNFAACQHLWNWVLEWCGKPPHLLAMNGPGKPLRRGNGRVEGKKEADKFGKKRNMMTVYDIH